MRVCLLLKNLSFTKHAKKKPILLKGEDFLVHSSQTSGFRVIRTHHNQHPQKNDYLYLKILCKIKVFSFAKKKEMDDIFQNNYLIYLLDINL